MVTFIKAVITNNDCHLSLKQSLQVYRLLTALDLVVCKFIEDYKQTKKAMCFLITSNKYNGSKIQIYWMIVTRKQFRSKGLLKCIL